jgi:hypothetical protein
VENSKEKNKNSSGIKLVIVAKNYEIIAQVLPHSIVSQSFALGELKVIKIEWNGRGKKIINFVHNANIHQKTKCLDELKILLAASRINLVLTKS